MPILALLSHTAFNPENVKAIGEAFDAVCISLELEPGDPARDLVARKVIECAQRGELDPRRLCALVLSGLGSV